MESETTLVGTKGGVELNTVTAVDLEGTVVVLPDDAELDYTLGDGGDLERNAVLGVLLEEAGVLEGAGKLCIGEKPMLMSVRLFSNFWLHFDLILFGASIPLYACWNSGSAGMAGMAAGS